MSSSLQIGTQLGHKKFNVKLRYLATISLPTIIEGKITVKMGMCSVGDER